MRAEIELDDDEVREACKAYVQARGWFPSTDPVKLDVAQKYVGPQNDPAGYTVHAKVYVRAGGEDE